MEDLFSTAADLQSFCQARGWRCCVIGGIAVQRWGLPRLTQDVDVSLLTGFRHEERFLDELLTHYLPRVDRAKELALQRRVLLARTSTGVPIDIALAGFPFEERVIERATVWTRDSGLALLTCSAEDLAVLKAFASRPQDWIDVEGIVVRQGARLNRSLILEELQPLLELKEDDEAAAIVQRLFAKHPPDKFHSSK